MTNTKALYIVVSSVLVVGVILLIVGGVILGTSKPTCEPSPTSTEHIAQGKRSCELSEEAKRSGFGTFLDKVKKTYYELHPFNIHYNSDLKRRDDFVDQIKAIYTSYDPSPEAIKRRTDASFRLLKELNSLDIAHEKLKGRERKAYAKVKLYLQQVFGRPFEVNYYTGDWMLGPDSFCYSAICYMGYELYNAMLYHVPKNLKDVDLVKSKLMSHKEALVQYVENLKMGVRKGMVRNILSCKAGVEAFKIEHQQISLHNATGKVAMEYRCSLVTRTIILIYYAVLGAIH